MRVESSTSIPTDVHTRDNDTSDTERKPGVDFGPVWFRVEVKK